MILIIETLLNLKQTLKRLFWQNVLVRIPKEKRFYSVKHFADNRSRMIIESVCYLVETVSLQQDYILYCLEILIDHN